MNALDRFMSHTQIDPSGCLLWTGSRDRLGYGRFRIGTRSTDTGHRAHHAAWLLAIGPIPAGLVVRHRCDNPPCVAVDHLELGTQADNIRDRDQRGRQARGSRHGMTRLAESDVARIRALRGAGWTQQAVADSVGVSRSSISDIERGRRWGWLR